MNLLITGAWNKASEYICEIEKMGHTVKFQQYESDVLQCDYEWVEGVICNGLFLTHPIEKFVNLRYIQLTSAGFDRVSMDYIKEHNIEIHNAKGVYSTSMAEFAIAGVLQLYKQMEFFRENQKKHEWNKHRGLMELSGKTVCIIGCGSVGTACAKLFHAFGCEVVGINRTARMDENYKAIKSMQFLNDELTKADIVILTLPLTTETRYLMDANKFSLMKDRAVIVNLARGAIIDTADLIAAMDKLGGAVLDVFEEEPLGIDSPLWDIENIIVTPHNSFMGENNQKRLKDVIFDNLWRQ